MTVINVALSPNRAMVLTDGLIFSMESGLPLGFGDKCFQVENKPIVVATRGDIGMTKGFAYAFPHVYDTIDDAVADDFTALKWVYDAHAEQKSLTYVSVDAVFVGWSFEQNRPVGVVLTRRDNWQATIDIPCGDAYFLPRLEGVEKDNFDTEMSRLPEIETVEDFDPRKHGLALVEAQRRSKQSIIGVSFPPVSLAGGHITLTIVSADGVTQETIHRWPDVAGEPIEPAPFGAGQRIPSSALQLAAERAKRQARANAGRKPAKRRRAA